MQIYRHYKNKFYKLLGTAKHSETMEEFALYETMYESPGGRTWVRPKAMFFEEIEVDGVRRPRFAPAEIKIQQITQVEKAHIDLIAPLIEASFGEWDPQWFYSTFNVHSGFHLGLAILGGEPVAFKLGYAKDKWTFYSWLGAVHPEWRGFGLASQLMRAQHEWAKNNGFHMVQTKTQNRFRDMLLLNLRHGFEITGTNAGDKNGIKILLEKSLVPAKT